MKKDCEWCADKITFMGLALAFIVFLVIACWFTVLAREKYVYCQASGFFGQEEKIALQQTIANKNILIDSLEEKLAYSNLQLDRNINFIKTVFTVQQVLDYNKFVLVIMK